VLIVGGGISELVLKSASDDASAQVVRADGTWWEPGFVAGIDFTSVIVGLLILALGSAMHVAARHAEDADGVV
jgi:hypothetical protein